MPWPFVGRILSAVLGRLDGFLVGSAGRREGAGAGITAVYVNEVTAIHDKK